MIPSRNLAFSSLRTRLRLTMSTWLLAKTWAYQFAACSARAVFPAYSLAAGSVQRVFFTWISRAVFSVMNAGHSLLVAGCAPSQFGHLGVSEWVIMFNGLSRTAGHLGDSLFGQSSCMWVPEHNVIFSSQERCSLAGLGHQKSGKVFLVVPFCHPWLW